MRLQWHYSADPSDTMAGKAVDYFVVLLGGTRRRVHTITQPSYDPTDLKIIEPPLIQMSTSTLFLPRILRNTDRICFMSFPLDPILTSIGVVMIQALGSQVSSMASLGFSTFLLVLRVI